MTKQDDNRDLNILRDLDAGYSIGEAAHRNGASPLHVQSLWHAVQRQ